MVVVVVVVVGGGGGGEGVDRLSNTSVLASGFRSSNHCRLFAAVSLPLCYQPASSRHVALPSSVLMSSALPLLLSNPYAT